jgi:hypothetical protein
LSRQPLADVGDQETTKEAAAQICYVLAHIPATDEKEIWKFQQEDITTQKLSKYSQDGWPDQRKLDEECRKFRPVRDEITVQDGLVMKGCQIIIKKMRDEIIGYIHRGHMGIAKCRARESVWWPGILEQIAETVRRCPVCVQERQDRHEPLIPSEFPERPWQKVPLDLFKLNGKWFMVLMDYYSRYPEVTELTRLTAAAVINRCQSFFARHGVPEEVRSDCGSQFKELEKSEFHKFAKEYGFIHRTSSPRYPQSNGFAEAAVKTVKTHTKLFSRVSGRSVPLFPYRSFRTALSVPLLPYRGPVRTELLPYRSFRTAFVPHTRRIEFI